MNPPEYATLSRDVRGVRIPEGMPSILNAGQRVRITQSLGGSYTVVTDRGEMIRLEDRDADAIGREVLGLSAAAETGSLEERVWAQLKTCFDPEIPVNVVDLGLIYSCDLTPVPSAGGLPETTPEAPAPTDVRVLMTLTAPGCGMGPVLADDVKKKIEALPGVGSVDVEVVWDPPWNPGMMTEAARLQLGMF
ncbi:MAG TPA: putative Fe-S cluster assembly protein SufT [Thermoanaerobaculia bacterium]|jgi:probable FeS assembly SUF system protein SufT|nr:putative Fe-S cluster assembly protein SufT [Thermoanaerobaculia bacterium]